MVLGIDIGTQSVKVVIYDGDRREWAAVTNAPLKLHQSDGGVAEQKAEWWVEALKNALQQIEPRIRNAVTAIGVSGQQHGFVPLDHAGRVLAPVKLWCDTSTTVECHEITQAMGGVQACIAESGNAILPGYTVSKVRWLRNAHPKQYADMDCILLPHDYINFYLTGEQCMEAGDASGTGFFDVQTRTWSEKVLRAIDPDRDLRECLPDVAVKNRAIGGLRTKVADELGLPQNTPVSIGGGDNMMSAIGTGNVQTGVVSMSLGTSGTVYAYSDRAVVDSDGYVAAFCSSTGGWLPLVCNMNCTVGSELLRELFNVDLQTLEEHLQGSTPGSEGIVTIPFFNGERTPNLPNAKGSLFGLDGGNMKPENLLRSAVEGATFGLRFGLSKLENLGIEKHELVLTGGGANSKEWRQIVADVCQTPVKLIKNEEGAALGAALQALAMLGDLDLVELCDVHLETDMTRCCDPDASAVGLYDELYAKYQQAVDIVANYYKN